MKLVYAEDLIASIEEAYCNDCQSFNGVRCRACDIDKCKKIIQQTHAIDAVLPVRCSNCVFGKLATYDYPYLYRCTAGEDPYKSACFYCATGIEME